MPILGASASGAKSTPVAPTIGTATDAGSGRAYNNGSATVTFTAPNSKLPITSYTVTSSPGSYTGTGSSSPITVAGLQSATAYTFTVTATSSAGTSAASSASNSITATTVPQTPTITSATRSSNTVVSIAFTGATGGAALSAVTATSSPSVAITSSGTSSPMTATATYAQSTSYTFTITATNANGTSSASSASNSVTPFPVPTLGAWTLSVSWPRNNQERSVSSANGAGFWAGAGDASNGEENVGISDGWRWNGSGWSAVNFPSSKTQIGAARTNTTTTDATLFVGGGDYPNTTSGSYGQSYSYNTSGSFINRTNYYRNVQGLGIAALNTSGNIRGMGGNTGGPPENSYYITSIGGTWTNSGVANPYIGVVTGIDNNFGGEGWYFAGEGSTSAPYKATSSTSAFTTMTSVPYGYSENNVVASVVNNVVLLFPNRSGATSSFKTPYSFNGSTYTAQTIWPGGNNSIDVTGGASDATTYRLVNTQDGVKHYFATMS